MATESPLWLNSPVSYAPVNARRADTLMVMGTGTGTGGRSGVRPGTGGLMVSVAGTAISVTIGGAFVHRSGQGTYRVVLATAWSGTLAAADATYARVDLVYLRVWDTDVDASGLRQGDVVYLVGTPSATPSAPTPGTSEIYIPLGQITVPAVGGGSVTVADVRPITVAPGGILPVAVADLALSGLYAGQTRYHPTRGLLETWTGSTWLAAGDTQSYTPAWTASTTNPFKGSGSVSGQYSLVGDTCTVAAEIVIASDTNPGSGAYSLSLPFPVAGISRTGTGQAVGGSGPIRIGLSIPIASGNSSVTLYAPAGAGSTALATLGDAGIYGSNSWVAGNTIRFNGTYKIGA